LISTAKFAAEVRRTMTYLAESSTKIAARQTRMMVCRDSPLLCSSLFAAGGGPFFKRSKKLADEQSY
jgi:hypothetical protein